MTYIRLIAVVLVGLLCATLASAQGRWNKVPAVQSSGCVNCAPLHQKIVALNASDILSLETPLELMAAPGADLIVLPQYIFLRLGPCPEPYGGYGEQIQVLAGTNVMLASILSVDLFGVSDPNEPVSGWALPRSIVVNGAAFLGSSGTYDSDIRNKPINIQIAAGTITGGTPADWMTVTLTYLIFNTSTGLFE